MTSPNSPPYSPSPWFFVSPHWLTSTCLEITDAQWLHHAKTVMRLKAGEALVLIDESAQRRYEGIIQRVDLRQVIVDVVRNEPLPEPKPPFITAAVALIKETHWDWMLQKLVESGVSIIIPLITDHSVVLPKNWEHKQQRWQAIIRHAAQQSEQPHCPQLLDPMKARDWMTAQPKTGLNLFSCERYGIPLVSVLQQTPLPDTIRFMIGPEGGWSDTEILAAETAGFQFSWLGPRILRCETAAIHVAGIIQAMACQQAHNQAEALA